MVRLDGELEGRGDAISDQQRFLNAQSMVRCKEMGRGGERERKKKSKRRMAREKK